MQWKWLLKSKQEMQRMEVTWNWHCMLSCEKVLHLNTHRHSDWILDIDCSFYSPCFAVWATAIKGLKWKLLTCCTTSKKEKEEERSSLQVLPKRWGDCQMDADVFGTPVVWLHLLLSHISLDKQTQQQKNLNQGVWNLQRGGLAQVTTQKRADPRAHPHTRVFSRSVSIFLLEFLMAMLPLQQCCLGVTRPAPEVQRVTHASVTQKAELSMTTHSQSLESHPLKNTPSLRADMKTHTCQLGAHKWSHHQFSKINMHLNNL